MNDVPAELLRDFAAWAESKGRDIDLMLLDELLRLRSSYDELEPTYWPPGSVEHLLLERFPSKGPTETPEPEVVSETLDAYFRFLRSTGRMSRRSADPKELTREARRNARRMHELAEDRVNWSPNKVLADFGRTIGIDLDGAPDLETLQQRLEQIQQAWNELPVSERRRLMPRPGDPTGEEADELPGREVAMRLFGTDDQIIALLMTFADRLPDRRAAAARGGRAPARAVGVPAPGAGAGGVGRRGPGGHVDRGAAAGAGQGGACGARPGRVDTCAAAP